MTTPAPLLKPGVRLASTVRTTRGVAVKAAAGRQPVIEGEALRRSLLVTNGDIVVFADAVLTRWGPHFARSARPPPRRSRGAAGQGVLRQAFSGTDLPGSTAPPSRESASADLASPDQAVSPTAAASTSPATTSPSWPRSGGRCLGARLLEDRSDDPREPPRVYAGPAGHPFRIFVG